MLYIFRVDTGRMITLEMNLALETVAQLKKAVETSWAVPEEKQVGCSTVRLFCCVPPPRSCIPLSRCC